jgi:hypothetical protein
MNTALCEIWLQNMLLLRSPISYIRHPQKKFYPIRDQTTTTRTNVKQALLHMYEYNPQRERNCTKIIDKYSGANCVYSSL